MKTINSRTNETIKHVASLNQKKQRSAHKQFIAEGLRTCTTLIESGANLLQFFVTEQHVDAAQKLVDEQLITIVADFVMEKLSSASTPSGIIGQFAMPEMLSAHALSSGLVLAEISDPGNMGTLIRTAAALNQKSIVLIGGADPYSPKVIQSSAGTIGMVNIFQWEWHELLEQKGKHALIALVVSGGKTPSEITAQNALLVVGSEAHGIPEQWIQDCDEALTLPMPGSTESLNAAVAGSIALYLWAPR